MKIRGLVVTAVIVLLIIGTITLSNTRKDHNQSSNNLTSNPTIEQSNYKHLNTNTENQINKIDSITLNQTLEQELNNHPAILTINHSPRLRSHFYHDEVTVKFKASLSAQELAKISRDINGKLQSSHHTSYIFKSDLKSPFDLVSYFSKRDDVIYAEPNFLYMQNQQPNDLLYRDYQYNLPMIQTEAGWNISTGSDKNIIAVIDSGVDLNHPDLRHRLVDGYNVLDENSPPNDDNGHGTHVAGIIASETNNGLGVAGITWFNKIMPIKAMNAEGYGSSFDIAKGIVWAVDHGANVINMSLGNYQYSDIMRDAVAYAFEKDVMIVAATGNDHTDQTAFPAAYPEVFSVSAVNNIGNFAEFSNFGTYVDVVAPGVNIPSTYIGHQYAALSGTSMAAPHVSALAGLIRSTNPALTNDEVMAIIRNTTTDLGQPGKDVLYGDGLINVEAALKQAKE